MRLYLFSLICALTLIFSSSCDQEKKKQAEVKPRIFPQYHISIDSLIRNTEGILRGIDLGISKADVFEIEKAKPSESDSDYVFYEYAIDSVNSYSIAYTFVSGKVEEIEIQINSHSPDLGEVIVSDLKDFFTKKYTAPLMDNGIYVFNCFDSKKKNFIINLSDNSTTECGIINVLIYREK